jgi:hypothetical protein
MGDNVEALAQAWLDAKRAETKASESRLEIEAQICAALEVRDEGAITHKLEGFKVTLTQPATSKVDETAWALVSHKVPADLAPVKTKIEADAPGIKWLQENKPGLWNKIAGAFTTKPGKVAVKVEVV